jgi:hypothetical protein
MANRPEPVGRLDRYFAAATIAHEYVADLHRELVELRAYDVQTQELLGESASVVLARMPDLTRELRSLERKWAEQELLDPHQAERTVEVFGVRFTELEPELAALRARQDEIVTELAVLVDRACRG